MMDHLVSEATAGRVLCRLEEIPDGTGKGFEFDGGEQPLEIFVVRDGERAFAYRNVCPHTGSPLDWQPDDFMSEDGSHIMCHTHGALFEIEDGFCIAGPCAGDQLRPVAVEIDEAGNVVLGETVTEDA
jgi:naringenin degradation protein FdeD